MFKSDITIIGGCGHVGLPLGLVFSDAGKKVALLDIDQKKIDQINQGNLPFKEEGASESLVKALKRKGLIATSQKEIIQTSDVIVLVTGTPLDEYLNPRVDLVFSVLDHYVDQFRDGQLLVLRSTLYPSTTEKVKQYFIEKGKHIHVTFCPERIIEGKALVEICSLPQIISGFSSEGIQKARDLFLLLTKKIIELSPLEAELTKLFANAYRYIHFSIANQFFQIASSHQLNFDRIYSALIDDYPRMKSFPKPGFTAGPCLLKDTMQLSAFTNNQFALGQAAMFVNENMPRTLVEQVKKNVDLSQKSVGVLGMAFKAESDDKRDSLSYKLVRMLKREARTVYCSDEYIQDSTFICKEELVQKSDAIIIGAPHRSYASLDYQDKQVFDIWGITR